MMFSLIILLILLNAIDLFGNPIQSKVNNGPISALAIGSIRNNGDNSLIVGAINGQIAIYHLENLALYFNPALFKGKPPELGMGKMEETMKEFDMDLEGYFDPNAPMKEMFPPEIPHDSASESSRASDLKMHLLKINRDNIVNEKGKDFIIPHLQQQVQANISLIKFKRVYISPGASLRTDCIFLGTSDGFLYCYTLECNPNEVKASSVIWRKGTGTVEVKESLESIKKHSFHLVGLKMWQFSAPIQSFSFTKIWNKYLAKSECPWKKSHKPSKSFGFSDENFNDILICASLINHKVVLFPYSSLRQNHTSNELSYRNMYELQMLNIQMNVFVSHPYNPI